MYLSIFNINLYQIKKVAPGGLEPPSQDSEPQMLGHYTTELIIYVKYYLT